jgi:nucleoside-diphosphate-sugar epimerase
MNGLRVLFLGGTGTISAACVRAAAARGHDVTVVNRGRSGRPLPDDVCRVVGDVRDADLLRSVIRDGRFDVVADFLSFVPSHVATVLSALPDSVGQYIFVSSASAYEKPPSRLPVTETTPLHNPFWQYSRDKIACEELLFAAHRAGRMPVTVVRPSHTYDETRVPTLTGWTDIARMRAGRPVVIHGDGTSLWTITHADDFAVGFVGLVGHPRSLGEAFTITGSQAPTWNQIHEWLASAAGVPDARFVHVASSTLARWLPDIGPRLLGDKAHSMVFDTSKLQALVPEFATSVTFDEGARRMIQHHDAHAELRVVDAELDAALDRIVAYAEPAGGFNPIA